MMNRNPLLSLPLAGLSWAAAAVAAPVEVEVIAEDQDDDFFAPEGVRAPSRLEPGRDREPPVVESSSGWAPPRAAPPLGPVPTPPAMVPRPRVAHPSAQVHAGDRRYWSWWGVPSHAAEGDLILSVQGGGFAAGGFGGIGFEGMASDQLGLRLAVRGAAFQGEDIGDSFRGNWNFFDAGRWGVPQPITSRNLLDGVAHLVDLDATLTLLATPRPSGLEFASDVADGRGEGSTGWRHESVVRSFVSPGGGGRG